MHNYTIDNLRYIIRYYRGSKDASERLIRLRASCELIRRNKVIQNYKQAHYGPNKGR